MCWQLQTSWLSRRRCTLALSIYSILAEHLYAIVVGSSIKLCCQCESVCVCLNVRKPTMFKVESVGDRRLYS